MLAFRACEGLREVFIVGEVVGVVHRHVAAVEPGPEAPLGVLSHGRKAQVAPPEVPGLHARALARGQDLQVEGDDLLHRLPRGILPREHHLVLEGALREGIGGHLEGEGHLGGTGGQGEGFPRVLHTGVAGAVPARAVRGALGAGVGEGHPQGDGARSLPEGEAQGVGGRFARGHGLVALPHHVGLEGLGLGKEGLEGVAGREGEDKEGQKEGSELGSSHGSILRPDLDLFPGKAGVQGVDPPHPRGQGCRPDQGIPKGDPL